MKTFPVLFWKIFLKINIFEKAFGKSFRDDARASAPRRENAFPAIPTFQLPLHAEKSTLQNRRGSAEKIFTILPESLCISESPRRGIILVITIITIQIMCQEAARTPRFRPRTSVVPSHGRSYPKPRRLKSFGKNVRRSCLRSTCLNECVSKPCLRCCEKALV